MPNVTVATDLINEDRGIWNTRQVTVGDSIYDFYMDNTNDFVFRKSPDGGVTWNASVEILAGSNIPAFFAVWKEKWTDGLTDPIIHLLFAIRGDDTLRYRQLDTSDDSLGTLITIASGADQTWSNGAPYPVAATICKMRGGVILAAYRALNKSMNMYRSTDNGDTWSHITSDLYEGFSGTGTIDWAYILPGNAADSNDGYAWYWDNNTQELTFKLWDNSAGTWGSESAAFATSMLLLNKEIGGFACASVRHSDGEFLLVVTDDIAHLVRFFHSDGVTVTEGGNVKVADAAGWEGSGVGLQIVQSTNRLRVCYADVIVLDTAMRIFFKESDDDGVTWGAEQAYSETDINGIGVNAVDISIDADGGWWIPRMVSTADDNSYVNTNNAVQISGAGAQAWNVGSHNQKLLLVT